MPGHENKISLHLEFERGSKDPKRVFLAMNGLIEALQSADALLIKGFHLESELRPEFWLEDIQAGSLRTNLALKLYSIADSVPEEALESGDYKKVIGALLIKGKHKLAAHLASKNELPTSNELQALGSELQQMVTEGAPNVAPLYSPPTSYELLQIFQQMTNATAVLTSLDRVTLESENGNVLLQQTLVISDCDIKEILTRERVTNTNVHILQVRRPDFLGGAQWEFKHLEHSLKAKIRDQKWLDRFQQRLEVVLPGDALRVEMTTTVSYGPDWQELEHDHTINRVIEVLPATKPIDTAIL